jgi:chloramphenicol-sensitive protein RarD
MLNVASIVGIAILVAMWGVIPHVNLLGVKHASIEQYTALREFFTMLISLIVVFASSSKLKLRRESNVSSLLLFASIAGLISFVSMFLYTWLTFETRMPTVISAIAYPLGLAVTVVMGSLLMGERLTLWQYFGVFLSIVASVLLCLKSGGSSETK